MRIVFLFSTLVLISFGYKKTKMVIASYSKFSAFERCGKQEIILFDDSTYLYRVFLRKNETRRAGRYKIVNGKVIFLHSKRIFSKVKFDIFKENSLTLSDSISYNDKIYYKSRFIGAPCIYRKDSIEYNRP